MSAIKAVHAADVPPPVPSPSEIERAVITAIDVRAMIQCAAHAIEHWPENGESVDAAVYFISGTLHGAARHLASAIDVLDRLSPGGGDPSDGGRLA